MVSLGPCSFTEANQRATVKRAELLYGSIQHGLSEYDGVIKPITPEELQVKSLTDKSAQLKKQAKKTKSLQQLQKAKQKYAQVNSTAAMSAMG